MDLPVLSGVGGLKLTCMKNRRNSLFYTLGLKYKCGLFSTTYTYDRNANLTSMMRKGILDVIHGGVGKLFGLHGYEEMTYSGNKLTAIRVQSDGAPYEGRTGVSYNGQSTVAHNSNGNMTIDESRNIVEIKYNRQNLPVRVTFGDGHRQTITYDRSGRKIRTEYSQVPEAMLTGNRAIYMDSWYELTSVREYFGPYVFTDGKLEYSSFAGGYFNEDGDAMYYVTDWQGNNVAVVNNNGLVTQRTTYYPYGEPTIEPTGQRYLFGGKEREHAGGRNSYDFGARWYYGMEVVLHSCNTGKMKKGKKPIAQQISRDFKNIIITAPDANVSFLSSGREELFRKIGGGRNYSTEYSGNEVPSNLIPLIKMFLYIQKCNINNKIIEYLRFLGIINWINIDETETN